MNQLWELSDTDLANCSLADNDKPFFIPIRRTDFLALRVIVPYQYVTQNGGGLPSGANCTLSIVDETDSTTYVSYGATSTNRWLLGTYNASGHAEYQILAPMRLPNAAGQNFSVYYFDVVAGDIIELDDNGTVYYFIYGTQETPPPFVELKAGRLCIGLNTSTLGGVVYKKNNSVASLTSIASSLATGTHEGFGCFRVKFTANFSTLGVVKTWYSKPYKVPYCEDSYPMLTATFPAAMTDCEGHVHSSGNSSFWDAAKLFLRIPADLDREPARIKKTYNERQFCYKSEVTKQYRLLSEPIPEFFESAILNLLSARNFYVDNIEYFFEQENFVENPENPGYEFKNLNVPLLSSKCEKTFVCS
jgi:hypothetical protein